MRIETTIPIADDILGEYRGEIGADFDGYQNHVFRMINYCFALGHPSAEERDKIVIAGCFHDIGIWTGRTFDYLPPSIDAAKDYLHRKAQDHLSRDVETMIDQHHKIRKVGADDNLAELFRKGDLVDFSLGFVKFELGPAFVRDVKLAFPNAGFHRNLVRLAGRWCLKHPLNPIPVLKW